MVVPQELKDEYPFAQNSLKLSSGHTLNYVDEGEGPVVMMVHGNPTWSFFYRNLTKGLMSTNRVIVPDHIGCGLSDKPSNYEYTLENHINNALELLDGLKIEKLTLIVHDWGGAIGMGVATRRPDSIQRVVAMNTAAFRSKEIPFTISICKLPLIGEFIVRRFNAFAWPATFMAPAKKLTSIVKKGFLLPYNSYRNRIATAHFVKDIPLKEGHRSYQTLKSVEEGLSKITCPILLLWGERDFCFTMNFFKRWKEFFPNAKTKTYPEAGHYLIEDEKEDTLKMIKDFIQ